MHRNGQKPGEYPLNRGSLVIDLFKPVRAIVDLLPNAGGHSNEHVTALLSEELGVTCRTQEVLGSKFLRPIQRTTILQIRDPLRGHLSLPMHGQRCLVVYTVFFHGVRRIVRIAGTPRDHGESESFHLNAIDTFFYGERSFPVSILQPESKK